MVQGILKLIYGLALASLPSETYTKQIDIWTIRGYSKLCIV